MRSRLDTLGVRISSLQVPEEEEDLVRYLPLLRFSTLRLRILGVAARAQVALDLALVDQVVVVSLPDDPDAPGRQHKRGDGLQSRSRTTLIHVCYAEL